jgi:hypothetical protein
MVVEHPFLALAAQFFVEPVPPGSSPAFDFARVGKKPVRYDGPTHHADDSKSVSTSCREVQSARGASLTPRAPPSPRTVLTPRSTPRALAVRTPRDTEQEYKARMQREAGIPDGKAFPHQFSLGWKAREPLRPPQYSYNPITSTVDKFLVKPDGAQVRERTSRSTRPVESSVTDALRVNRRAGVVEYGDLMRPTNPRWNSAYHEALTQNPTVFRRTPGPITAFAENCVRKTGKDPFRP